MIEIYKEQAKSRLVAVRKNAKANITTPKNKAAAAFNEFKIYMNAGKDLYIQASNQPQNRTHIIPSGLLLSYAFEIGLKCLALLSSNPEIKSHEIKKILVNISSKIKQTLLDKFKIYFEQYLIKNTRDKYRKHTNQAQCNNVINKIKKQINTLTLENNHFDQELCQAFGQSGYFIDMRYVYQNCGNQNFDIDLLCCMINAIHDTYEINSDKNSIENL